jgi:pseudouridine-5'-phosphate glycosidase
MPNSSTLKVSRRDFAHALESGCMAGTTIAGTAVVASRIGIKVIGTGGLGGVHRHGESSKGYLYHVNEADQKQLSISVLI